MFMLCHTSGVLSKAFQGRPGVSTRLPLAPALREGLHALDGGQLRGLGAGVVEAELG